MTQPAGPPARTASARTPPVRTLWQVKASTLCNLRCRYCYEWDRLADRRRLPLSGWRRVFQAMADYAEYRFEELGIEAETLMVWHGGEPLLLPVDYIEEVLALQREMLGPGKLRIGRVINGVQTNLYRLNPAFELMVREGFMFSVSHDATPDVRLALGGQDSAGDVEANLRVLADSGASNGVAVVLGRHNHTRLAEVHDALEATGAGFMRINPMFTPPGTAPGSDLELTPEEAITALTALMRHRAATGSAFKVEPLGRAERAAARRRDGGEIVAHNRRSFGETRFVVHPDGALACEAGVIAAEHPLGNVIEQDMADIVRGPAYRAVLDATEAKIARHCDACDYRGACDIRALLEFTYAAPAGPCPIEARLCAVAEELEELAA